MSFAILLATRNTQKLAELRRILAGVAPRIDVVGLDDVPAYGEVPETGETFAANALLKAREGFAHTALPTIADDSGLVVDALNAMPGVLSARWSGRHGDDEANLRLVLAQLADVPEERRGAAFVCAVAFVDANREEVLERDMRGRLVRAPRGENGFGYDPIFVAEGYEQTNGELAPAQKDAISHRGQAMRALIDRLSARLLAHSEGNPS